MTTIIVLEDTTDTDAVLSSLRHDAKWLLQLSNDEPESFVGREGELYSILNVIQLVVSRFARVAPVKRPANDTCLDPTLDRMAEALNAIPTNGAA